MGATKAFTILPNILRQSNYIREEQENLLRETFDLLTLVNQSYQALEIGELDNIYALRSALEDVESVKKTFMESNFPSDMESLGLASSINSSEELETFERMVSFFEKRKPVQGISWEMFSIHHGQLYLKSSDERELVRLEIKRKEAVSKLIDAIKAVEDLGLIAFENFESPVIGKEGEDYTLKSD